MLIYSLCGEGDAICKLAVVGFKKKKKNPTSNQGNAKLFIYPVIRKAESLKRASSQQHVTVFKSLKCFPLCIFYNQSRLEEVQLAL